jgi:hypothetical protein
MSHGAFPSEHGAAVARRKADAKPFEPAGEPPAIDQVPASAVPPAQVMEIAPATASGRSLASAPQPVEAVVSERAAMKAPNKPGV